MSPVEIVRKNVERGFYDAALLEDYNQEEWNQQQFIRHDRDENPTYAAMEQFRGKYPIKNRVTNEIFQHPSGICVDCSNAEPSFPHNPPKYVKEYYDAVNLTLSSIPLWQALGHPATVPKLRSY